MAIAPLVKKYLSVGVLGLTATAAYFQARGTSYLLASWVTPNGDALAASPRKKPNLRALTQSASDSRKSAEPILERNAFDSVTGPLNKAPIEIGDAPSGEDEAVDTSNPLSAPECGDVAVNIVTESTDPLWSLAALRGPGDQSAKLRRVGDDVGDKKVAYIGFNSVEGSPSVWLTGGGSLCQALLFAEKKAAPAAATSSKAKPPSKRPTRGAPKVPKDIADKISKVSETEFNVDRSVVDKILENQAALMKSARIVPEQKNGKVVGIRMFGIRKETLLGTLGFQNGDRLETINGFNMASPEKALEAYARLRTANKLSVKINRRGKPMTVDFKIK